MDNLRDTRGKRYATAELAQAANARIAREDADRAAKERAEADRWEAELRQRYMATPGATDDDWKRDRDSVISEARKRAALDSDDTARTAFAAQYR
jgi:hypothetical protein